MGDVIDGDLYQRINDLAGFEAEKLDEADRAERARELGDIADDISGGGDHPVEVAVVRHLARGVAEGEREKVDAGMMFVQSLYRGVTETADNWYELEYVYSQEHIDDLEADAARRLAE